MVLQDGDSDTVSLVLLVGKERTAHARNVQEATTAANSTVAVDDISVVTMEAARLDVRSKLNDPHELQILVQGPRW